MGKTLKTYADYRIQENLYEYDFYKTQLELYCLSMFKWTGLPDSISARFIERSLFYNGFVIFFKSKELDCFVVSNATPIGINDYEEPIAFRARGINKLNETVQASECVVIQNNVLRRGNIANVNFFAKELSNIKKTFDLNLEQLKNPYILECDEGQLTTVQNLMRKKQNGEPYIFARKDATKQFNIANFNLGIQNHTPELIEVMNTYESKAKTHFGINNNNVFKKERLVSNETQQNNEEIELNRKLLLDARKQACEEIKEMFDINIDVEFILDTEDIGGNVDD